MNESARQPECAAYGNPLRVKWISKPEMLQFLNRLKEPTEPKPTEAARPEGLQGVAEAAQPGPVLKPAYQGNQ